MEYAALFSLGMSAISAKYGFDQASEQRRETAETIRRLGVVRRQTVSENEGLGNASGITSDSGSLTTYLNAMNSEMLKQSGAIESAGNARADASEFSSLTGAGSNFGGTVFKFGAANSWLHSPSISDSGVPA